MLWSLSSSASCVRRAGGRAPSVRTSCDMLAAAPCVCHSSQMVPVHAGVVTLEACCVLHLVRLLFDAQLRVCVCGGISTVPAAKSRAGGMSQG